MTRPINRRSNTAASSRLFNQPSLVSYYYEEELQDDNRIIISVDLLRELAAIAPGIITKPAARVSMEFEGQGNIPCFNSSISRKLQNDGHRTGRCVGHCQGEYCEASLSDQPRLNHRHCRNSAHLITEDDEYSEDLFRQQTSHFVPAKNRGYSRNRSSKVKQDKIRLDRPAPVTQNKSRSQISLYRTRNRQKDSENDINVDRYPQSNAAELHNQQRSANGALRAIPSEHVASQNTRNSHVTWNPDNTRLSLDEDQSIGLIGAEVRRFPVCKPFALPVLTGNTCVLHHKDPEDDHEFVKLKLRPKTAFSRTPRYSDRHKHTSLQDGHIGLKQPLDFSLRGKSASGCLPRRGACDQRCTTRGQLNNRTIPCHKPEQNSQSPRPVVNKRLNKTVYPSVAINVTPECGAVPVLPRSGASSPTQYVLSWLQESESATFTNND